MRIELLYELFLKSSGVNTDTRKIKKNSIFFALRGENFNGNMFAEKAIKNGSKYAIVEDKNLENNKTIFYVTDVLKSLQKLANYHRNQLKIPFLAITGSNGKTTTKELIAAVLSKKYKVYATKGNLNNHIGVPLTLLSVNNSHEFAVIEMGANHQKEIEFLTNIVEPDYGYITNFGKAHLEGFGSVEGVIKGKTELYNHLRKKNKTVFINQNDPIQVEKTLKMEIVTFQESIKLLDTNPCVKIKFKDNTIHSNLIGNYNFSNIAAAVSIGNYFNILSAKIKDAIESFIPNNNRSQIIKKGSNQIILDAYNANPTSMLAALENFKNFKGSFKIVVIGDMLELGKDEIKEHQSIVDFLTKNRFSGVFLVGDRFCKTKNQFQSFIDFENFKREFTTKEIKNSTILIKGSRGMKLERIIDLIL